MMALGLHKLKHLIYRYLIQPILIACAARLNMWANHCPLQSEPPWKQNALNDFADWLQHLPEAPDQIPVSADRCDLYMLLQEFVALRQEIKFQNREQHAALKSLAALQNDYERALQAFTTAAQSIDTMHAAVHDQVELKIAMPFLDIRDSLVRGLSAAQFFSRMPHDSRQGIDGIVQGYDMALRRFDRALSQIDIQPIAATGKPFNAIEMKAVGTACRPDEPAGVVLEEYLSGVTRYVQVLRTAEVIVNQHQ